MSQKSGIQIKRIVSDGWANLLTGLGVKGKDASMHSTISWQYLGRSTIEHLYAGEPIARKIVDKPAEGAMEPGFTITGLDDLAKSNKIKDEMARLNVENMFLEGIRLSRLTGGSILVKIYKGDKDLSKEPKEGAELLAIVPFDAFEAYPNGVDDIDQDIFSSNYRKPKFYNVHSAIGSTLTHTNEASVRIHYKRVIRFEGLPLPRDIKRSTRHWGDSYLSPLFQIIQNYAEGNHSVAQFIKDFSITIYKMQGLADAVSGACDEPGVETGLMRRLEIVNLCKSIYRAVLIDGENEEIKTESRNVTGIAELVGKLEQRLSAATDIPATVLFGTSPGGSLGQSGNHESDNWYAYLASIQNNQIKAPLTKMVKEIASYLGIPSDEVGIEFNAFYQLSDQEHADLRNKQAQTDQIYITQGVLDPNEVALSRFGGDHYSMDTQIDREARQAMQQTTPPDLNPLDNQGNDPNAQN